MKIFDNPWLIWLLIAVCISIGLIHRIAEGQDKTALHLVQCIRAECDQCPHPLEPAAIAHVLRKHSARQGKSLDALMKRYCSVFRDDSARAKAIRGSTFDAPLHGDPEWWKLYEVFADEFLAGNIPDPLPSADHFGGGMDTHRALRAGWVLVVHWSNWFWNVPPKGIKASEAK